MAYLAADKRRIRVLRKRRNIRWVERNYYIHPLRTHLGSPLAYRLSITPQ